MSDDMIVRNCSPTLAGLKTGSIFSCDFASEGELTDSVRRWNTILVKKGLRMLPLRYKDRRALIYVYRPSYLSRDLRRHTASRILSERGYRFDSQTKCIIRLMQRLGESREFPHEIGLFLGYPPEDVRGFIENRAGGCKYVGTWKVYGDEEEAKRLFAAYKRCTAAYRRQVAAGESIERLTVAC